MGTASLWEEFGWFYGGSFMSRFSERKEQRGLLAAWSVHPCRVVSLPWAGQTLSAHTCPLQWFTPGFLGSGKRATEMPLWARYPVWHSSADAPTKCWFRILVKDGHTGGPRSVSAGPRQQSALSSDVSAASAVPTPPPLPPWCLSLRLQRSPSWVNVGPSPFLWVALHLPSLSVMSPAPSRRPFPFSVSECARLKQNPGTPPLACAPSSCCPVQLLLDRVCSRGPQTTYRVMAFLSALAVPFLLCQLTLADFLSRPTAPAPLQNRPLGSLRGATPPQ